VKTLESEYELKILKNINEELRRLRVVIEKYVDAYLKEHGRGGV